MKMHRFRGVFRVQGVGVKVRDVLKRFEGC